MLALLLLPLLQTYAKFCRNTPANAAFPADHQWQALNNSLSGHLLRPIPSAQYCRQVNCTDQEWASAHWRNTVPGAMNYVNFEQDFDSNPPSLCWRTTPQTCGQGDVPIYAILAENANDIQAGINFARKHNLRLSIKSSGHDLLGRSTAKHSLLIHTHKLQSIEFTDSFKVGNVDLGSAVTVGSGVGLSALYNASREVGKIYVGGIAATVAAAGGYIQGGGHSPLSPLFGMASDNALEFHVITADGTLRRVNSIENPDLFWALRGGGAGSWGVIVNATFKTYPTFTATRYTVLISASNSTTVGSIATSHAKHIFDLDNLTIPHGQYFGYTYIGAPNTTWGVSVDTFFPNSTAEQAIQALTPLFKDIINAGGIIHSNTTNTTIINELLATGDDLSGVDATFGSRLIPEHVYRSSPETIGDVYKRLIDAETYTAASVVLGGKISENHHIKSALNPAWRNAKSHIFVINPIPSTGTIEEINQAQRKFKSTQLPILESIQGPIPAAYTNEADGLEENWQSVFYGGGDRNRYERLSETKKKYDPFDLFIVNTGVGSERWDSDGICRV